VARLRRATKNSGSLFYCASLNCHPEKFLKAAHRAAFKNFSGFQVSVKRCKTE